MRLPMGGPRTVGRLIHFRYDKRATLKGVVRLLASACDLQAAAPAAVRWSLLDTFDGRAAAQNLAILRCEPGGDWLLLDLATAAVVAMGAPQRPAIARQLKKIVGDRPLLALGELAGDSVVLSAEDANGKQVARVHAALLRLEAAGGRPKSLGLRVWVEPRRGYKAEAARLADVLAQHPVLTPLPGSLHAEVVATLLPEAARLAAKPMALTPDTPTAGALATILRRQLAALEANEAGVKADVHMECLHDFRVALRRARTAAKAFQGHLPPAIAALDDGFRWLSAVTGPLRDLDVHLADFPALARLVPDEPAAALAPMLEILRQRRAAALGQVVAALDSADYQNFKVAWRQAVAAAALHAAPPLAPVADAVLWKTYKRIVRDGQAITPDTPAEALHELRKKCKRLRYLLEFFHELGATGGLVKALKGLQDCLGAHQDYAVQHDLVREIRLALSNDQAPAGKPTIAALAHLEAVLAYRQQQARADFAALFAAFAGGKTRRRFEERTTARKALEQAV